jgi:hypothetical protein
MVSSRPDDVSGRGLPDQILTLSVDPPRNCPKSLNLKRIGALGPQDAHIASAIAENPSRAVAVSIFPTTPEATIDTKSHFMKILSGVEEILFFDSRTHPLGDASLRIS